MARNKSAQSYGPQPAGLSPAEIRAAIPRLERRIAELEALPVEVIDAGNDPRVLALDHAINGTLADIFGANSLEYFNLKEPFYGAIYGGNTTRREQIEKQRQRATALLRRQVELMKEQLGDDGGNPADRAIRAYSNLDLHPEIARAASDLYRDGHYANAIEDAVKALNAWVRLRSSSELDGTALMQKAFSPNAPVLRFNDLADQSDRDEQQGFMMMFSGAVAGLRNPRAHKLIKDDPERALEFIAYVSLLAKMVDEAKKTPSP